MVALSQNLRPFRGDVSVRFGDVALKVKRRRQKAFRIRKCAHLREVGCASGPIRKTIDLFPRKENRLCCAPF